MILSILAYAQFYEEYAKIGPDFFRAPDRAQKNQKLQILGQFLPILAYFGAPTHHLSSQNAKKHLFNLSDGVKQSLGQWLESF